MLALDHVVIPVADPAASLAFYRDVLGLSLLDAITGDDWGGHAWLMMIFELAHGRHLVLTALRGAPAPGDRGWPADARHYAFVVDDLAPWRTTIASSGARHWEEDHGTQRSLYFADPSGNILEVTTTTPLPPANPA